MLTFIDEYSRYTTVYLLKRKTEAAAKWRQYRAAAERYHGTKVKELRCDNGGEYIKGEVTDEALDLGISITTSQPHSPPQNGTAERYNRTIMERVRAQLHHSNIPLSLWGELVLTCAYLGNRLPSRAIAHEVPYQRWNRSKEPPDVSNLRILWSVAFMHTPRPHRRHKHLSPRAAGPYRLIGYSAKKNLSYRLYDESTRKIYESRDVTFDESQHITRRGPLKDADAPYAENSYEVEYINAKRYNSDGEPEWQVKWVGYDDEDMTWEPRDHICHTDIFTEFEARDVDHPNLESYISELVDIAEPKNYNAAINDPTYSEQWRHMIKVELDSLIANNTWTVVDAVPEGQHLVDSKWVFKVKRNPDQSIKKFKARFCARGFTQRPGVDFDQTYSPVIKLTTLRAMLAIAAYYNMEIHHMDVMTAFLNADIDAEIYMTVPIDGKPSIVRLNKSIYGLKQSPRLWNRNVDNFLKSLGFTASPYDSAFYVRYKGQTLDAMISLYVDDVAICTRNLKTMRKIKKALAERYRMEDMGELAYLLGIIIKRDRPRRLITLSQSKYVDDILHRFKLDDAAPLFIPLDPNNPLHFNPLEPVADKTTYQSMVGSLMYLMLATRPDLAYPVSKLSQYSSHPRQSHYEAAIRTLRYAKATRDVVLTYGTANSLELQGFSDADYAKDLETRRSISGYIFLLNGGAISWKCQRQRSTALSTAEAEYMALAEASKEAIWLQNFLTSALKQTPTPITLYEDNQAAIAMANNPVDHQRSKHIDIRYHFTRDCVERGQIHLRYLPTLDMLAAMLTKPLPKPRLTALRQASGLSL